MRYLLSSSILFVEASVRYLLVDDVIHSHTNDGVIVVDEFGLLFCYSIINDGMPASE